jgi:nitroreductase
MDVFECIRTRRSIRQWLSKPVEFEKIVAIIEAGHCAPSAGNLQDWRFIIVTDREIIRKLPQHCIGQSYVAAPVVIAVCSDTELANKYYGLRGKRLYSTQDAAAAIENMLLAAHALGLGACWIGAFDEDKIKEIFQMPEDVRPQALVLIGYPGEEPPPKKNKDLQVVTYFNTYGNKIQHLNRVLKDYSIDVQKRIQEIKEKTSVDKLGDKLRGLRKELKERKH